jgi:adenine/guanine/hypoxanthine permease
VGVALASIIDGRLGRAATVFAACAAATLFGLMHSPLPSGALFWPWLAGGSGALAAAYGVGAGLLLALARMREER